MKRALLAIAVALTLTACGDAITLPSRNCETQMQNTRNAYGPPEEINTYTSTSYKSESWWYWSHGIEYTFAWGSSVIGCDVTTYTFTPIP